MCSYTFPLKIYINLPWLELSSKDPIRANGPENLLQPCWCDTRCWCKWRLRLHRLQQKNACFFLHFSPNIFFRSTWNQVTSDMAYCFTRAKLCQINKLSLPSRDRRKTATLCNSSIYFFFIRYWFSAANSTSLSGNNCGVKKGYNHLTMFFFSLFWIERPRLKESKNNNKDLLPKQDEEKILLWPGLS